MVEIVIVVVHRKKFDASVGNRGTWEDTVGLLDRTATRAGIDISLQVEQIQIFAILLLKHEFFVFVGFSSSFPYCLGQ